MYSQGLTACASEMISERVAVMRRIGRDLGSHDAAGARAAVVHDHLPAKPLAQMGGNDATDDVVAAAGREWNDQAYRFARIVLCRQRGREGEQQTGSLEQDGWI